MTDTERDRDILWHGRFGSFIDCQKCFAIWWYRTHSDKHELSTHIPSRGGKTATLCSIRNPPKREVAFLETSDKRKTIQRPARTDHTTRNVAECLIINALANYAHWWKMLTLLNLTISGWDPVYPLLSGNRLIKANYATRLKALQITIRTLFLKGHPSPSVRQAEADG